MQNMGRSISPEWMGGVKRCFVFGQPNSANECHSRDEVTKATSRLNEKHPTALISVNDLAEILDIFYSNNGHVESDEKDDIADSAEGGQYIEQEG